MSVNIKLQKGINNQEDDIEKDIQQQETKHAQSKDLQKNEKQIIEGTTSKKDTDQNAETNKSSKTNRSNVKKTDVNRTKKRKQVFSFRADTDDIAAWKAYATVTGCTMETIGTAALNEYLKRHKLKGADLNIFEAMKAKIADR